jgi:Uma2 family endonuclease
MSTLPADKPRKRKVPPAAPLLCVVAVEGQEVRIPPSAHTLAGFRAWATSEQFPERGRISFLDGELFIDMSPEEIHKHNKVKSEVGYALIGLNKKRKLGEFYSDRMLLTNVEANISTEPDAAFATWESLESGKVRLVPREDAEDESMEMEGTPDWVLEIVSKYSVRKDTRQLRDGYYRAGIPEYWLINARGEEIAFQILVAEEGGYEESVSRGGWAASPLFGRRFRLVRERGRLGHWEYTLQVKPLR